MSEARDRILKTAGRLFAERGYELVGINELIEKSDVAKATFYQHFGSKEKLCLEWLEELASENEREGRALLESPATVQEKISRKFRDLGRILKASKFRGCPFSNTAAVVLKENAVRGVVDRYKASARHFWHSLALQISEEPAAARALGDALFLLFSGAVTEAQNAKSLWPVESARNAALTLCRFSKT